VSSKEGLGNARIVAANGSKKWHRAKIKKKRKNEKSKKLASWGKNKRAETGL